MDWVPLAFTWIRLTPFAMSEEFVTWMVTVSVVVVLTATVPGVTTAVPMAIAAERRGASDDKCCVWGLA